MELNEYQTKAMTTRLPTYTPEAAVMGLLAEAGEVAAVFQKLIRGDYPPDVAMTKLHKELGDVLWHLAAIADDNDWAFETVGQDNLDKLESRRIRNMLLGDGDTR